MGNSNRLMKCATVVAVAFVTSLARGDSGSPREVGSGTPDLHPWRLTDQPDVLWTGRLVQFTLVIWNGSGTDVVETYGVVLKYRPEGGSAWTELGNTQYVYGHDAWELETVLWHWYPASSGMYEFQVDIDSENDVGESDEKNNNLVHSRYCRVNDPPDPPIRTLILTDSWMMVRRGYEQTEVDQLMDDLDDLAENDPRGKGVVIDIADFEEGSSLKNARDNSWDANMGDRSNTKSGTNTYANVIDRLIEQRRHYDYPDLQRVIIAGSHEIIPMYVRSEEPGGSKEQTWGGGTYAYESDMHHLYEYDPEKGRGNYITDAKYADLSYLDCATDGYLTRELEVGRLVETPTQISSVISNYMAVDGINPMDDIALIGSFEFKDGAYKAAGHLEDCSYTPDKTLIGDSFVSTSVPTKINAKDDFVYFGGHGDYNSVATDAERDVNEDLVINDEFMAGDHATRGDTNDLNSLPTAVIISVSCHAGALMPNKTYAEGGPGVDDHDLPEEYASKGVIAYLASTGYTWITKDDGGPEDTDTKSSEKLCSEVTRRFAWGRTIGASFVKASNDYYLDKKDSLGDIDRKVLGVHQLYGLPGYKRFSNVVEPNPGGWHFGETNRQQVGSSMVVQTTLHLDTYSIGTDGTVLIPDAAYIGDPETPNLPVIRYEEPESVPVSAHLTRVTFYPAGSWAIDYTNVVPTVALAQRDGWLPAEPFTRPGMYPEAPCVGYTILTPGGEDATVGLVIHPVQYDPIAMMTRIWQEIMVEFEYDLAQVAFYDSFADGDLDQWTVTEQGNAAVNLDCAQLYSSPYCLQIVGASASGDRVKVESRPIEIAFSEPYYIEFMFRYDSFHWDRFLVFGHVRLLLDQANLPMLYDPVGDNSFVGHTVGPAFNSYAPSGTWMRVRIEVDPASRQYTVRVNDTLVGTVTYQSTVQPSSSLWFEDNGSSTNYLNARYDDFLVDGEAVSQPPDYDEDGDVDEDDLALLEACATGPGIPWTDMNCFDRDLDNDGDVDQTDFGLFQRCFSGADVWADPD